MNSLSMLSHARGGSYSPTKKPYDNDDRYNNYGPGGESPLKFNSSKMYNFDSAISPTLANLSPQRTIVPNTMLRLNPERRNTERRGTLDANLYKALANTKKQIPTFSELSIDSPTRLQNRSSLPYITNKSPTLHYNNPNAGPLLYPGAATAQSIDGMSQKEFYPMLHKQGTAMQSHIELQTNLLQRISEKLERRSPDRSSRDRDDYASILDRKMEEFQKEQEFKMKLMQHQKMMDSMTNAHYGPSSLSNSYPNPSSMYNSGYPPHHGYGPAHAGYPPHPSYNPIQPMGYHHDQYNDMRDNIIAYQHQLLNSLPMLQPDRKRSKKHKSHDYSKKKSLADKMRKNRKDPRDDRSLSLSPVESQASLDLDNDSILKPRRTEPFGPPQKKEYQPERNPIEARQEKNMPERRPYENDQQYNMPSPPQRQEVKQEPRQDLRPAYVSQRQAPKNIRLPKERSLQVAKTKREKKKNKAKNTSVVVAYMEPPVQQSMNKPPIAKQSARQEPPAQQPTIQEPAPIPPPVSQEPMATRIAKWMVSISSKEFEQIYNNPKKEYDFVGTPQTGNPKNSDIKSRAKNVRQYIQNLFESLVKNTKTNPPEIFVLDFLTPLIGGKYSDNNYRYSQFEMARLDFNPSGRLDKTITQGQSIMILTCEIIIRVLAFHFLSFPVEIIPNIQTNEKIDRNFKVIASVVYRIALSFMEGMNLTQFAPNPGAKKIIPMDILYTGSNTAELAPEVNPTKPEIIVGMIPDDRMGPIMNEKKWVTSIHNLMKSWMEDIYNHVTIHK